MLNIARRKNGRFCKKPSSQSSTPSSFPRITNLIRQKKRIAEGPPPPVIKSEPEASFELDATNCGDDSIDHSSGPHSIQYNEQKPSQLIVEEPASANNCEDYFLIKEIGAIKTDDESSENDLKIISDVEYVVKFEHRNDNTNQDVTNDDIDLRHQRTFRACRAKSKLKETLQKKQKRLLDEIISRETLRKKQQQTNDKKIEQRRLPARIDKRKHRKELNEQQKLDQKMRQLKRREYETVEQRASRLMAAKISQQKHRANETFLQRTKRLLKEKIRQQQKRLENETSGQKQQRLLKSKFRKRKRLKSESMEQREKRLLRQKIRVQKLRENETFEQRQQRLLDQKVKRRKRIENETAEERKKRLMAARITLQRYRERQQRLSAFRDYQRKCSENVEKM